MVFLDANTVIYLVEQPTNLGPRATARVSQLLASGERLAVSDLVRMECQVGPLKANDAVLLAKYATLFASPDVQRPASIAGRVRSSSKDSGTARIQGSGLAAPGSRRRAQVFAFSHQGCATEEVP